MPGKPGRPPLDRGPYEVSKKRKSVTDESNIEPKVPCTIGFINEDSESRKGLKKKGFSWNQYLNEEIGIPAPAKLFRNVRCFRFITTL
jgi:hypothetical protein